MNTQIEVKSCTCGFDLCPECGHCHSLHCRHFRMMSIDCDEALREQSWKMRLSGHLALFFQVIALIAAWQDLQDTPSYISRYTRQENRLYNRLKKGETVEVKGMWNDKEFAIQPVAWEGIIMAYNCLVDGEVSPECKGKMLSCQSVNDWTDDLIERA